MKADELIDWLIQSALDDDDDDLGALLDGLCAQLLAAGLPALRASISLPTLDPESRAVGYIWQRGAPVAVELAPHGPEQEDRYRRSVIHHLFAHDIPAARWRLERGEGVSEFELLRDLGGAGATDYLLRLVRFGEGTTALYGVALSLATDRPGGFTAAEIAQVNRFAPALALAAYRIIGARTAKEALGLYLGPRTARRVLAGEIRRGEGHAIEAAILYADLRGFTQVTERADPHKVVGWLNEHLDAIGTAVAANEGEILKFVGDGLLAVFPSQEGGAAVACARALRAALEALAANRDLNGSRAEKAEPALDVDAALHVGEVIYGNVGAARRLDFTVIGRAVNEASRMEGLCDRLGRNLVMSADFAAQCGRPTVALGDFALRGIAGARTVYGLAA